MPEPGDPRKTPQGVPYADLKHIVNADGLHLFCRYWEPEAPPSGTALPRCRACSSWQVKEELVTPRQGKGSDSCSEEEQETF
ncbi:unnamed protein product [Arctogadus glacialis]